MKLLVGTILVSLAAFSQQFPKQPTRVSIPSGELAIQMERQSGDIRVLSARIEGLDRNTASSLQRIEADLSKNRDQHQDFERRIEELHADFRIYPWLFTVLGATIAWIAQHLFQWWLKRITDKQPSQTATP